MTPRTPTPRSLLITMAVALLLLAPSLHTASAGASDYSPSAGWKKFKEAFSRGDIRAVESLYNESFARGADNATDAKAAVLKAIADAKAIGNTSDVRYKVAIQAADKSLYAIAYANVQAAAAANDTVGAKAWFDLLAAKFNATTDLAQSKAAFATVASANLSKATATLNVEYPALIRAKVHNEAQGAATLLAADATAAAIEAAEARYYYLSVQPSVRAHLGAQADTRFVEELESLLNATLTNNTEAARVLATHVQDLLARHAMATADGAKAAAYAEYARLLKAEKNVTAAAALYAREFAHAANHSAKDAHARVQAALKDAEAALTLNATADFQVQRQILEKSIYEIAHAHAFLELAEGNLADGAAYFRVLSLKFGWDAKPSEGLLAVGRILTTGKVDDTLLGAAKAHVEATFLAKVREEIEEVFFDFNATAAAREKAIEAVVYFAPLKASVDHRLGEPVATDLTLRLDALYAATTAKNLTAAQDAASQARRLLQEFEADGKTITKIDELVLDVRGKLDFVAEEYKGHFEAKAAGDEKEAALELAEAKAFLESARKRFADNRAAFEAVDAQAAMKIEANYAQLANLLDTLAPPADLQALVDQTVTLLAGFKAATPEPPASVEGTVNIILGLPKPGPEPNLIVVPVTLDGIPTDGFAYQIKVRYDAKVLKAQSVDLLVGDVKTSDIQHEKGFLVFNGATTRATSARVDVAQITFRADGTPPDASTLRIDVEELADTAGKPLGVKAITGNVLPLKGLDLAGNVQVKKDSPAPAWATALGILALVALVGSNRRRQ